MKMPPLSLRLASLTLALALLSLIWILGDGPAGLLYAALFLLWLLPGLPLGWYLFGVAHPGAWVAGSVLGYPISALAFWLAIALGVPHPAGFAGCWVVVTGSLWAALWRQRAGHLRLPVWGRHETAGLLLLLLLVPAVVGAPFARIGSEDATGNRRYRAYFTADFLWHMALTAEIEKFDRPFRNPYLASEPLHYYWLSFVPPSVAGATMSALPHREGRLTINMLLLGLSFVAAIYLATWAAIGRAGPATAAVALAFVAASAEGLYVAWPVLWHGAPIDAIRDLNIDAITYWVFHAFTFDGLPRAIMYNPQHSLAGATGLIALTVASVAGASLPAGVALVSGAALGMSLMTSPFPGGALTLVFGLAIGVDLLANRRGAVRRGAIALTSVVPVAAALGWDLANSIFEGAQGDLHLGLHRLVTVAPLTALSLAAGPFLVPVLVGLAAVWRLPRTLRPSFFGLLTAGGLLFFISLRSADVWVGWRAGQVLLVTAPALAAQGLSVITAGQRRRAGFALAGMLFLAGLPTTVFDAYNAQDVENDREGPSFRWVVPVSRQERQALEWLRGHTAPNVVVQMDPVSRGRDTWTLIPSFAERRMSAGLPISLIDVPAYHDRSQRVAENLFGADDAGEAWTTATSLDITYIYLGDAERTRHPRAEGMMRSRPDLFQPVFRNPAVSVFRTLR
jgi:hypothetical protein